MDGWRELSIHFFFARNLIPVAVFVPLEHFYKMPQLRFMMRFGATILFLGVSLAVPATAVVTSGQNSPYQAIVERNAFQLRAPVITVAEPAIKPFAPPGITLTGITTILGRRMAFLTIPAAKPGDAPISFVLAEGQSANEIEVKMINEKAGLVGVMNHGEPQTLDFDHNGAAPSGPRNEAAPREQAFPRPLPPPLAGREPAVTPEEQVALIEIQRVKFQQENNPIHSILPATEMTVETPQN